MPRAKQGKGGSNRDEQEPELQGTRKQRIASLLAEMEKRLLAEKKVRVTLADFIRLTQLERELEQEEQPREIIVTWKDPTERRVGSR